MLLKITHMGAGDEHSPSVFGGIRVIKCEEGRCPGEGWGGAINPHGVWQGGAVRWWVRELHKLFIQSFDVCFLFISNFVFVRILSRFMYEKVYNNQFPEI